MQRDERELMKAEEGSGAWSRVSVVINPASGQQSALQFYESHISPEIPENVFVTTDRNYDSLTNIILVLSGDGTLHELINHLASQGRKNVSFVIVPCGTANALYASLFDGKEDKLQSLTAYLSNKPPKPLTLATLDNKILSSVVVSTALHASILHDSESLRAQHPSLERFKLAAEQNSRKWYNSTVHLLGSVEIYDPTTNAFVADTTQTLSGPFVYFLSVPNVDRLEPTFVIAPLSSPSTPSLDIVVLRPSRDPSNPTPDSFRTKTWQVLTAAYQNGSHIHLRYTPTGDISSSGTGLPVIEYYRCSGWEWVPSSSDQDAHLVCTDGDIHTIPPNSSATCSIDSSAYNYSVYT